MITRTRHYAIRDGNGRWTTFSIGFETDDPFAEGIATELGNVLETAFLKVADTLGCSVQHAFTSPAAATAPRN